MNTSHFWKIWCCMLIVYIKHHEGSNVTHCSPCLCQPRSRTMECSDVPYIARPPSYITTTIIKRMDFGSFHQYGLACLGNISGTNISELTLTGCKLTSVRPRKLFAGLSNLKVLRLNRTFIIPEDLRIAFYSLRTTKIRELYLDDLHHAPLPCHFFDGLESSSVVLISLRKNSIRNLGFSDHADVFQGVPGLKTLILSENQITVIENVTFARMDNLRHLFLDFNRIKRLEPSAFYIPSLVTLSIANNAFKFSSLEKTDKVFSHLNKLEVLNISGNDLRGVSPQNLILLFKNLSELTVLKIGHAGLISLPDGIFSGLHQIKEIYLEGNQIKTWNSEVFSKLFHLEVLYLNKNKIQTVSRKQISAFASKTHEVQLNLANNPFFCSCSLRGFLEWLNSSQKKPVGYPEFYTCTSPYELFRTPLSQVNINKVRCTFSANRRQQTTDNITDSCFPCQCTRRTLSCYGRSISYIPRPPSSVNEVLLHNMNGGLLHKDSFKNLTQSALRRFSMTNSTIYSDAHISLSHLSSLEELNLTGTIISAESLEIALSSLGPNIAVIILENMKLKTLQPNTFLHLKGSNLTTLSMAKNLIKFIPSGGHLFSCLSNLKYLDLSNNLLQNLTNMTFFGLVSLRHLDLGSNRIKSIESFTFNSDTLTHLWLTRNQYSFSQSDIGDIFRHLTSLESLDISSNDLSQLNSSMITDLFIDLDDLQILKLRNTGLKALHEGLMVKKRSLRILDLSNNGITELNSMFLKESPNLNRLYLKGNQVKEVFKHTLDSISNTNISHINLAKNPFSCSCNLTGFLQWINTTSVTLVDYPSQYVCASPKNQAGSLLSDIHITTPCVIEPLVHLASTSPIAVLCAVSVVAGALFIIVGFMIYFNRQDIWLASVRFKARLRSERIDKLIE